MSDSDFRHELENIVPDNLPQLPVGTLAELEKENLDPAVVPCCHKRVQNGSQVQILGCPYRVPGVNDVCKLKISGESGPQFFGVQYLKGKNHGGAMVRGVRDCFYIARFKDNIETPENGGSIKIIAHEGETFKMVKAGPETGYKDAIVEVTVPKFARPGENPDLVKEQLKAEIREEDKRRVADEQHQRNIGASAPGKLKASASKS